MVVSGIFLKGHEARIVTLVGSKDSHKLIAPEIHKLPLQKNPTKNDVDIFVKAFIAYCKDNRVEKVLINRRAISGKRCGGAGTFLVEGILLAISYVPIEFVHPNTVIATNKKKGDKKKDMPKTVDLGKAYDIGFEGLN